MTTTMEIAQAFAALCREGRLEEAQRFWAEDVTSVEAFPSPYQTVRGPDAIREKQRFWSEGTVMHGVACEGPYLNGDRFALAFSLDCTGRDGVRATLREVALYTVADGRVVEERFFPLMAGAEAMPNAA